MHRCKRKSKHFQKKLFPACKAAFCVIDCAEMQLAITKKERARLLALMKKASTEELDEAESEELALYYNDDYYNDRANREAEDKSLTPFDELYLEAFNETSLDKHERRKGRVRTDEQLAASASCRNKAIGCLVFVVAILAGLVYLASHLD